MRLVSGAGAVQRGHSLHSVQVHFCSFLAEELLAKAEVDIISTAVIAVAKTFVFIVYVIE